MPPRWNDPLITDEWLISAAGQGEKKKKNPAGGTGNENKISYKSNTMTTTSILHCSDESQWSHDCDNI